MTNVLMYKKINMNITGIFINCKQLTKEQSNVINFLYNKHRKNKKYTFEAIYSYNDYIVLKVTEHDHNLTLLFVITKEGNCIGNSQKSMINTINKLSPIFTF